MDIDLLSKMVKELILDNDKVVLPGFGAFVAEIVPSTFSDKGYTINPPYRKLYFRARPEEDMMLIKFYADSNKVELAVADKVIRDFVVELKSVLFSRKTVVFPGLGRLRATKENAVFFVADEDMDIYPEGFGLEPISLKTHVETPQQISEAVAELKAIVDKPVEAVEVEPEPIVAPEIAVVSETIAVESEAVVEPEVVSEPEVEIVPPPVPPIPVATPEVPVAPPVPPAEPVTPPATPVAPSAPVASPAPVKKKKTSFGKVLLILFICLLALVGLFFAGFLAVAHWAPDFLDTILYTPEELEILNYR